MNVRNFFTTRTATATTTILSLALMLAGCSSDDSDDNVGTRVSRFSSESGTLQISEDDSRVFALNRDADGAGSLSVIQVRSGDQDVRVKLGEVGVGDHPESVSVDPASARAYVSNGADSTISVVDLTSLALVDTIAVGSEPRGTALTPSGRTLYVANHSDGTLSAIDTVTGQVTQTITLQLGGRAVLAPHAVLVTNDGDGEDSDETVYVADFFSRARPGLSSEDAEGHDDGREGLMAAVSVATGAVTAMTELSPMASGFSADRTLFDTANGAANDTYKSTAADPTKTPQSAFFNQLHSISSDDASGRLYVNAIGAQPEPPIKFNVNVQALVGVVDADTNLEVAADHVNLNDLIKVETQPAEPFNGSLDRAFAGDTVDMAIRNGRVLMISRAGSYSLRAYFDGAGRLELRNDATTPARRVPTGSIPSGVVLSSDGTRGYVNADVDQTITAIDMDTNAAIGAPIESSGLPAPGTTEHNALIGKLVFFTGLGTPADGLIGKDVRSIDTHAFRGMASDNNWSSCASCHPNGLTDNVTWIFPTGPRQTPALDASYSAADPQKQRVFNWNAVRGSVTDFNNNSRNIQGGKGFTAGGDADAGQVFNHGPNLGVSDALDLETLWVQIGVRTPSGPSTLATSQVDAGRAAFIALDCKSCHGGDQWTSSQVRWSYPLFPSNPLAPGGAAPLDDRVKNLGTGPVILSFDLDADGLFDDDGDGFEDTPVVARFDVAAAPASPTLDSANPLEIRGGGGGIAKASVGGAGSFNPPSLLGMSGTGPYGHHGRAQSVADVFTPIASGGLGHPTGGASAQQLEDLAAFLLSIDAETTPIN